MAFWALCVSLASGCAGTASTGNEPIDSAATVTKSSVVATNEMSEPLSSPDEATELVAALDDSDSLPAGHVAATETQSAEVADDAVGVSGGAVAPVEPMAVPGFWSIEPPAPDTGIAGPSQPLPADPCKQYDPEYDTWLDRSQVKVYQTVCGATAWFDGFFGNNRYDQATGQTYGRISMGGYWDQLNGFDPRLRFRARFALPSLRERTSLLIGRGDEDDLIEERTTAIGDEIPTPPNQNPNQDQDVSTYIGFGFDRLASLTRGLRFTVGLKLRNPPVPIVKIKYRRNWQISERDLLSVRPLVYWRSDEGAGATLQVDVDHVINNAFLFRWANFGNVSQDEEVEGVNWGSTFYLYQALSEKKAVTYSVFFSGETKAPITFQNAGFELRYRQSILRKWLFIEPYGSLSWPRFSLEEKRESNFGVGLRLEAYFGPAPDEWMR